ncbi:MAG: hypothetical protein J7501_07350 [Bdellovibrio sp.]|nr:hypothetical protein [Bdellovibrio sp.]
MKMKSLLTAAILLATASAQASFLCTSKEIRDDGKPAYGMSVNESPESDKNIVIAVWATGQAKHAKQFNCTRSSLTYGTTAQYTCEQNEGTTLQVFTQENNLKFTAVLDMYSADSSLRLANMYCKRM